ncbi:anti-sigma-F factor Fin family protein [Bacillus sp. FJAT-29790]|uniref:anti-sigma-F factor Fin family protein n=1 Tax=Bacillus sp. FJAT-29790 TaxID=1895002 RepID=UPI001C239E97|nr:anti-sigma-F factor Fin family protein [Bacillus sp. FJAT-29790]
MAIHYHCRHCGVKIGTIENTMLHTEQLGFHTLNDAERQEMISYDQFGDLQVKAICEDCHELLERNPDYHQHDFLIQ